MSSKSEARWLEVFHSAMLVSDNDWKSSIAVADAVPGTLRPPTVTSFSALPGWGCMLTFDKGETAVQFTDPQDPSKLRRLLDEFL